MRVPILKQGDILVASVQSALTDAELMGLQSELTDKVGRQRIRGVVIDVSVLDVLDSFACRMLRSMTQVLRLRGAETVVVGIQPEVAFAMVQLGLRLEGVHTLMDIDDAMAYLNELKKAGENP